MLEDNKENRSKRESGALDKFEPGSELGTIEDRNAREERLNSLPAAQKELAQESARFADLCQYFSLQRIDIPPFIVEKIGKVSHLPAPNRFRAMQEINRELMEYLNDVGQDPGIRQ